MVRIKDGPTEEELTELAKALWKKEKPSVLAQSIRARLASDLDSGKFHSPDSEYTPDYIWELIDIAAQRALNERT